MAINHLKNDLNIKTINYIHISIEEHVKDNFEKYDAVVASEIIEHVAEKDLFMDHCIKALKPGGSIFLTTMNQTLISKCAAVFVAENVLNLVPKNTHDWNKFISPHALQRLLEMCIYTNNEKFIVLILTFFLYR